MKGTARQNAFGSLLILGSQRVSRLAVLVAAAALLTTDAFATLALVLALTDLVRGTLQAFDVGGARLLAAGHPAPTVLQTSLDAKTVSGLVGMAFITLLAVPVGNPHAALLTALSGVGVFAASYGSSFLVERQAVLALHSVRGAVLISNAVSAASGIALAWLTEGAGGAVTGLIIGDVLLLLFVARGHRWQRPNPAAALALLRSSRELLTMQLAYIGQFRVGTIVLSAFGSALAVAEYSIASRVMEGLIVIAGALTASSLPLMAAAHAREERDRLAGLFERSYRLGLIMVAALAAPIVVAAPVWIRVLFPQYPDVGVPAAIVGLAVTIYFGSSQTTALLNATHHDRAATGSAVTGLVVSALGTFVLVPFGSLGVAWARVAGESARLVIEAAAGVRHVGIRLLPLARPWLLASASLAGAGLAVLEQWRAPYVWISAGVVFVAALASYRLVAAGVAATPQVAPAPADSHRYAQANRADKARAVLKSRGVRELARRTAASVRHRIFFHLAPLLIPFKRKGTFSFQGADYPYFYHRYNLTWLNERAVEIPIALSLIEKYRGRKILEVGNVLSHYVNREWDVIDKFEQSAGVTNADVATFDRPDTYDLILSISTIEHVGFDDDQQDPGKVDRALERLRRNLKPGGLLLITTPVGYNPGFDRKIADEALGFGEHHFLLRKGVTEWESGDESALSRSYGTPFPAANALFLGVYRS